MEHLKKPDRKKLKIEEDGKRRRKIIKILISTFLVVAVAAILIPVIAIFGTKSSSKGTSPTKSSAVSTTEKSSSKVQSTKTTFKSTKTASPKPTSRSTTIISKCFTPYPAANHSLHRWRCTNQNMVGSICSLSCTRTGYMSLKTESSCLPSGEWSSTWTECLPLNPCKMTQHNCSKSANCKDIAAGKFSCTCTAGYAGDGFHCGNDTDADGIPDYALLCSGRKSCKKDNCISIPNSGQEDADRDGIG